MRAIDPLNSGRLLAREAETSVSRFYAAWHPGGWCRHDCSPSKGHDSVTVVLIDDETRNHIQRLPPTFETYAAMIDGIAARKPKLIFLDLTISGRPHESMDPFLKAIERAQFGGTSVLVGQIASGNDGERVDCPEGIERPAGNTARALVCAVDFVVPIRWESEAGLIWYPFSVEGGGQTHESSPATVMFQVMSPGKLSEQLSHEPRDMLLAWPRGGMPGLNECRDAEPQLGRGLAERGLDAVAALVRAEADWKAGLCSYVPSASMLEFIPVPPDSSYDPLISGRAVIVGVSYFGSQDMHRPPQGPEVSGSFYHATALENLITHGVEGIQYYESYEPGINWRETVLGACLLSFITFRRAVAGLLGARRLVPDSTDSITKAALRYVALLMLAMVSGVVATVIAGLLISLPISNIFSIVIVVLVIELGMEAVGQSHEVVIHLAREHWNASHR